MFVVDASEYLMSIIDNGTRSRLLFKMKYVGWEMDARGDDDLLKKE